jgi:hypothetical protein
MARLVTCVCGRRFHIGHSTANVQCRKCGRWWSGEELSPLGAAIRVLLGGEVAGTKPKRGDRRPSRQHNHRRRQTDRKRPPSNPVGSVLRWLFS